MANRKYTPRRAGKRWREGAPDYILDCFDFGPETADRYIIIFGGPDWTEGDGTYARTWLHYLGCGEGGRGFSQWGEMSAHNAAAFRYANGHRRVRWLDLSEATRAHIVARATEGDS